MDDVNKIIDLFKAGDIDLAIQLIKGQNIDLGLFPEYILCTPIEDVEIYEECNRIPYRLHVKTKQSNLINKIRIVTFTDKYILAHEMDLDVVCRFVDHYKFTYANRSPVAQILHETNLL